MFLLRIFCQTDRNLFFRNILQVDHEDPQDEPAMMDHQDFLVLLAKLVIQVVEGTKENLDLDLKEILASQEIQDSQGNWERKDLEVNTFFLKKVIKKRINI